jgi:hypothetical protein
VLQEHRRRLVVGFNIFFMTFWVGITSELK